MKHKKKRDTGRQLALDSFNVDSNFVPPEERNSGIYSANLGRAMTKREAKLEKEWEHDAAEVCRHNLRYPDKELPLPKFPFPVGG
jgi:hypothetical protein